LEEYRALRDRQLKTGVQELQGGRVPGYFADGIEQTAEDDDEDEFVLNSCSRHLVAQVGPIRYAVAFFQYLK
jgi:hypothetical protein